MTLRGAIAVVALLALSLSGCSAITAVGEQTSIDLALSRLVSTLESEHGVTAVTRKDMNAEYHFSVTVTVDEVPREKRVDVVTAVDEVLGGSAFGSAAVQFTIGGEMLPSYSQYLFGADTLATDLEYWAAVEDAIGEVSFGISSDPDGDGPLTRARSVYRDTAMDFALLGDIQLDETALDSWGSLGVSATGTLPSAGAAAALAELTTSIPLRDYLEAEPGLSLSLDWMGEQGGMWTLTSASLSDEASDPAASTDWPIAVHAASVIAGAGIHESHLGYFSNFGMGGIVWLGECDGELAVGPVDTELFDGLVSAGVVMPAGSAPGWCSGG